MSVAKMKALMGEAVRAFRAGRLEEAHTTMEAALGEASEQPVESQELCTAFEDLARIRGDLGEIDKAAEAARELVRLCEASATKPTDARLATARAFYSNYLASAGELAAAEEQLALALTAYEAEDGPDHRETRLIRDKLELVRRRLVVARTPQ